MRGSLACHYFPRMKFIVNAAGRFSQWCRACVREPAFRELVKYCLPALVVGFVLRALLTVQMPYGYMQFDTADFLTTTHRFILNGDSVMHGKKTFLVPILYTLIYVPLAFLKVPVLIVIPLLQHALGLVMVLMVGALVRLWFSWWKWLIIPVTLITAANPVLLWFEHALMAEVYYIFCAVWLALAGTLWALRRDTRAFGWMLAALFFTAGARPEGKLFFAFGWILLVLVCWGQWREMLRRGAWLLGLTILTFPITRTTQAGQLLYATVLPLAPDESRANPELAERIRPLRDQVRAQWGDLPVKLTPIEKSISRIASEYLREKGIPNARMAAMCQKLAVEACLHAPRKLPPMAAKKFLLSTKSPTSVGFTDHSLYDKGVTGFTRKSWMLEMTRGLTGTQFADAAAASAFVHAHYHPMGWFTFLDDTWNSSTLGFRLHKHRYGRLTVPGIPMFFLLSVIGAALAIVRPGRMRRVHIAWVLTLAGLWLVVMLTGVLNPRYRFVFEPFCVIYVFLVLDVLGDAAAALARAFKRHDKAADTLHSPVLENH